MKSRSIYLKNFMFLCGIVIASFLIFGIAFITLMRSYIIEERKDSMNYTAQVIVSKVVNYSDFGTDKMSIQLNLYMEMSGNHIMIADEYGYITNCSEAYYCEHLGMQVDEGILSTLNSQGEYSGQSTFGGIFDTQQYIVAMPIYKLNVLLNVARLNGYVIVSSDASSFIDLWGNFASMFILVGIIVVVVSFFIAMLMARWQTAPMRQISATANEFAHGDFTARVDGNNRFDELGELIDSFNAMADSIEKSENQRVEFIANISHELKTPMTSINGFAEGILDGTIPKERQDEYLQIIASETKRLSRLVRDMLDTSKVEAMDRDAVLGDVFDLAEIMRRVLLGSEKRINDKKLDVEADIPDEPVVVRGQEDSIMQVVNNLLDNGIKFSDEGGIIGLKVARRGEKVYVTVKNSGEQIPQEELPFIFDRFHKTDRSRGLDKDGVGLGLHIVKMLINNHGENIYVKSENGITEFVFTLTPDDSIL